MNSLVEYRKATIDDIDQLVILRTLMQCEVNNIDPFQDFTDYKLKAHEYFQNNLKNETYISGVAVLDGKIISACGVVFYNKPPSIVSGKSIVGYVTNVFTIPEFRGMGHASQALKILIKEAQVINADKLVLGATEDGKGVYEKLGFTNPRFVNLELKI